MGQNARQVVTERALSYVLKKENLHISVVEISVFCTNQIAPGFFYVMYAIDHYPLGGFQGQ